MSNIQGGHARKEKGSLGGTGKEKKVGNPAFDNQVMVSILCLSPVWLHCLLCFMSEVYTRL